jgi:hypothetical protein
MDRTINIIDELEALATAIYHVSTFFIFKRIFHGQPISESDTSPFSANQRPAYI